MTNKRATPQKGQSSGQDREQRRAEALRANLKKRRARRHAVPAAPAPDEATPASHGVKPPETNR